MKSRTDGLIGGRLGGVEGPPHLRLGLLPAFFGGRCPGRLLALLGGADGRVEALLRRVGVLGRRIAADEIAQLGLVVGPLHRFPRLGELGLGLLAPRLLLALLGGANEAVGALLRFGGMFGRGIAAREVAQPVRVVGALHRFPGLGHLGLGLLAARRLLALALVAEQNFEAAAGRPAPSASCLKR